MSALIAYRPIDLLRSPYISDAAAYLVSAVEHLIDPADNLLKDDILAIAQHFSEPTTDFSKVSNWNDLSAVQPLLDQRTAQKQRHDAFFAGIAGKYRNDLQKLVRIMEYSNHIARLISVAPPLVYEQTIDQGRVERDTAINAHKPTQPLGPLKAKLAAAIPNSVDQTILDIIKAGNIKAADALFEALGRVYINPVSTSHPTDPHPTSYWNRLRDFAACAGELTQKGNEQALQEYTFGVGALFEKAKKLFATPITMLDKNGAPTNLSLFDEMEGAVNDVIIRFKHMTEVYRVYDDALARLSNAGILPFAYEETDRLKLQLNVEYSTWVMFDKDGHAKIRSEHAMFMLLLSREKAARVYAQALEDAELYDLEGAPGGGTWGAYFVAKHEEMLALSEQLRKIAKERGNDIDIPLSSQEFEDYEAAINNVYGDLNTVNAQFTQTLEKAGLQGLPVLRNLKNFGLGMLSPHLRETAVEHGHAIDALAKKDAALFGAGVDYQALGDEEKLVFLQQALDKPTAQLSDIRARFLERVDGGNLRDYKDSPDAIVYHTLRRMGLVQSTEKRPVGSTGQKPLPPVQLLAECTKDLHVMETLLLSKINNSPLWIIPLLEEKESLSRAIPILKSSFKHKAWRDHIWNLAGGDPAKIMEVLKIMYAHSDSIRRMGVQAGRKEFYNQCNEDEAAMRALFPQILDDYIADGRIDQDTKAVLLKEMDETPGSYDIYQYHGGSVNDHTRGGTRSFFAFLEEVGAQHNITFTVQGIDNRNETLTGSMNVRSLTTFLAQGALAGIDKRNGRGNGWDPKRDLAICDALDKTMEDYEANHFNNNQNQLGRALGHVGLYGMNGAFNGWGSRTERGPDGSMVSMAPETKPINTDAIRTIPFTATGDDMNISVAILPMRNMLDHINEVYRQNRDLRMRLQADANLLFANGGETRIDSVYMGDHATGSLTITGISALYKTSSVFRMAVDFAAYGAARTDIEARVKFLEARQVAGVAVAPEEMEYFKTSLPKDLVGATLPYLASRGIDVDLYCTQAERNNPTPELCTRLSNLVYATMPRFNEQMEMAGTPKILADHVREQTFIDAAQTPQVPYTKCAALLFRLCGVARQIGFVLKLPGASDPGIAKKNLNRKRKSSPLIPALA
ncbi:MAG: phosphoenolpyruvate carboxylase [Alphaproteobacteria bacterium]|nr:phosphoenolpyruvate carboxylase [Alphaproteobacteria bacterium]